MVPTISGFAGFENYQFLLGSIRRSGPRMANTLYLVGWVLMITVAFGTLFAVLFDQEFWAWGIARLLVIAPFFVMPTVSALVWKNLLMHPVNGLLAFFAGSVRLPPVDWFASLPLTSIVMIVRGSGCRSPR